MTLLSTTRWLIWSCCLAAVLLGARSASAAAPMCDERGASAIAPTPVLPIRDIKLESSAPLDCSAKSVGWAPAGRPAARGASVIVTGDGQDDAWVVPEIRRAPGLPAGALLARFTIPFQPSAGYRLGVFRPPRA